MNNSSSSFLKRIDWKNTIFLTLTPVVAIAGTAYVSYEGLLRWQTVALFFAMAIATGLGITAGYHRLFAHKSYDVAWPVRLFALLFSSAAFQNSAIKWSSDHRLHHQFTDTDRDPYSIKKGFWYAHILWVCEKPNPPKTYDNVPDLRADKLVAFQDRYNILIGVLVSFVLPTAIASLWGDPLGGLFVAGFLRLVINHHFTFFINSLCHVVGNQPYSTKDSSRDNWVMALFTYGEGYHNFHHTFPSDYRNGFRAYQWDPTKWFIWTLNKFGIARNLKRIPDEKPQLQRLSLQGRRVLEKLAARGVSVVELQNKITQKREQFENAYLHFVSARREYIQLKKQKMHDWNQNAQVRLEKLREDCRQAKANFKKARREWSEACRWVSNPSMPSLS